MQLLIRQIVNSIFESNTFILYQENSNYVWLIDAGNVDEIIQWADSVGKRIVGTLITHAHFDHIYGLNKLLEYNNHLKVYVGEDDKSALYSSKMNMSRYHEEGAFEYSGENVICVHDGDNIELFDKLNLKVISVPGHTPGCVAYANPKYIFTGDAYIPGCDVVTLLPRANKKLAKESWQKIDSIIHQNSMTLCAGHGDIIISNQLNL